MNGLDERFKVAFEDVDFAYRLKINDVASKFIKQASVCHPWRSLRKNIKNWKKKGYEWESLSLFLKKHPKSYHEYGNPKIYLRHAFRMITSDLYKCLFKMKGRGIDILALQFICTISTIIKLKSENAQK